jgi:uncharacterized cupin superfamily protein
VRVFNVFGEDWEYEHERPGRVFKDTPMRPRLGAEQLGASLYEVPPRTAFWPYHFHHGNEELLIVLAGTPTLREPVGERTLEPGDCVLFSRGPDGSHTLRNDSGEPARFVMFSTLIWPEIVTYPDSGKVGPRSEWTRLNFKEETAVDYWEGED